MMNIFNRSDVKTKNEVEAQTASSKTDLTQRQAVIRIIAGGYLLYLTYQIISEGGLRNNSGWKLALMAAALVAFVIFGAYWVFQGLKCLRNNGIEKYDSVDSDIEEKNEAKQIGTDSPEDGVSENSEKP